MPPTPSFCEKQNTDGIVPLHAQNVKNETFTKIKSRKTQAFVEQAEIFTHRYFFLAARGQLCYTKPVPTAGGVRLRRAVFCACPCIVDSSCRGLATKVQTSKAFPTCLRRPYLFSRKRKDRGEKSAWRRGVHSASEFRRTPMFRASFHTILILRMSWYAPPDTGASDLIPVAVERLPSIEGVVKIQIICTFLRGVLGLYAPNGLPWGKLDRRSRD